MDSLHTNVSGGASTVAPGHQTSGPGGKPVTLDDAFTLAGARAVVEQAGGFDAQLADIEAVVAHAGNNHTGLVERFFRVDRPTVFELAGMLAFLRTSEDLSVLTALRHALDHRNLTREHISDTLPRRPDDLPGPEGTPQARRLDLSFASQNWIKTVDAKAARHAGAPALRGDGVLLPRRGTALRGRGGGGQWGVGRLDGDAVALGTV
ncbi:hypothetical protein ACFWNE_17380 [Streptomyces goshikiensis]|uniref:hypothetical protein n=1 Tax=Streptomyces goshikiensis TaxID=1942 RepID=UPI003646387E